jgi:hypothetical protein
MEYRDPQPDRDTGNSLADASNQSPDQDPGLGSAQGPNEGLAKGVLKKPGLVRRKADGTYLVP